MHSNNESPDDRRKPSPPSENDTQQQLLADLEQLKADLAQMQEERLRERAELENQRKRLARDVEMARKFANERLLGDLLPVIRQPGCRPNGRRRSQPARCATDWN